MSEQLRLPYLFTNVSTKKATTIILKVVNHSPLFPSVQIKIYPSEILKLQKFLTKEINIFSEWILNIIQHDTVFSV